MKKYLLTVLIATIIAVNLTSTPYAASTFPDNVVHGRRAVAVIDATTSNAILSFENVPLDIPDIQLTLWIQRKIAEGYNLSSSSKAT